MSWDEIKKGVNSDLSVPLNHLIWLNDYKTYGKDSYVFQNKDILHELYMSSVAINDMNINPEAIDYAKNNNCIGSAVKSVYGIDTSLNWSDVHTVDDLINNKDTLSCAITNENMLNMFLQYFVESEVAMTEICNNKKALSILYDKNSTLGSVFASSSYLLSACQVSSLYYVTESSTPVSTGNQSARRIHYDNKCFVIGMSQVRGNNASANAYVTTLNGVRTTTADKCYGDTGLVWLIKEFAQTANCNPRYYYDDSPSTTTTNKSYMAILKIGG